MFVEIPPFIIMGKYYKKPKETGREYVDAVMKLEQYTIFRCIRLPYIWKDWYLTPLVQCIREARVLVCSANEDVYIAKNIGEEKLITAYRERLSLNIKALRKLKEYEHDLENILNQIDLEEYEFSAMTKTLCALIDSIQQDETFLTKLKTNPRTAYVKLVSSLDEMSYKTAYGEITKKLKLTENNVKQWLGLYSDARAQVAMKIEKDKKELSSIEKNFKACKDDRQGER